MKRMVTCEACNGHGERPLSNLEVDTIAAVTTEWSETSAIRVRLEKIQKYKISGPALCNRLNDLADRGLVERRAASGRHQEWRAR